LIQIRRHPNTYLSLFVCLVTSFFATNFMTEDREEKIENTLKWQLIISTLLTPSTSSLSTCFQTPLPSCAVLRYMYRIALGMLSDLAIDSAVLVFLVLFGTFITCFNITTVNILAPLQLAGLLVGCHMSFQPSPWNP